MNGNRLEKLKDTFPSTPVCFTLDMGKTLAALPARSARWKFTSFPVAAYALVTCAAAALLIIGLNLPKMEDEAPVVRESAATAQTTAAQPTAPPLPAPPPLPQLAVSHPDALPASAGGWQAAALSGDVTWYYNPSSAELAFVEGGKTVSISLDLPQGNSVDPHTFLPGQKGCWLAFTVHRPEGDTVWVVTEDGRKMVVPDDIRWVDVYNYPIETNFTGISMYPISAEYAYWLVQEENSGEIPDGLLICATFTDGTVYRIQVSLSSFGSMLMNDRRGFMSYLYKSPEDDDTVIIGRNYLYTIAMNEQQQYQMNFHHYEINTELRNNRFLMFKLEQEGYAWFTPYQSLLMYREDPANSLWEFNMTTGETVKVDDGCLAFGWIDDKTYWFASGSDPASINIRTASSTESMIQQTMLEVSTEVSNNNVHLSTRIHVEAIMKNSTGKDIEIPAILPCSLELKRNDEPLWSQNGSYRLSDANLMYVNNPGVSSDIVDAWPAIIPSGASMIIELFVIEYEEPGLYTLSGSFNGNDHINSSIELPYPVRSTHQGIEITGRVNEYGRLSVDIANHSHASYSITQAVTDRNKQHPPTLCYRLLRGETEVETGTLQLAMAPLYGEQRHVPIGGTRTLTEPGASFFGLPAGEYRVECLFLYNAPGKYDPWVFEGVDYFETEFTVQEK